MADIVERVVIQGDSTGAQKASKKTEKSLTSSFIKANVAANVLNKTLGKGLDLMKQGIADAQEYERTMRALNTTLELAGQNTEGVSEALEFQAAQLQDVTGASDEVIRRMQTQAIALGVNAGETKKLITASFGLANALGKDVNTAFEQLLKSTKGTAEEMVGLLPEVQAMTREQLESGAAIDFVAEKYSELASVMTEGTAGSFTLAANAAADFAEEMAKQAMLTGDGGLLDNLTDELNLLTVAMSEFGAAAAIKGFLFDPIAMRQEVNQLKANAAAAAQLALEANNAKRAQKGLGAKGAGAAAGAGVAPPDREIVIEGLNVGVDFEKHRLIAKRAALTEELALEEERALKLNEIDMRIAEGRLATAQSNAELQQQIGQSRSAEIERWEMTITEITQREAEKQQAIRDSVIEAGKIAFTTIANAALGALEAWAEGSEVSMKKVAANVIKGIGTQLFQRGIANTLIGAEMLLTYQPNGGPLIAVGLAEMAAGAGMVAGGAALGKTSAGAAGGGNAGAQRSPRGGSNFRTGIGGNTSTTGRVARSSEAGETTGGPITIVFNGPTTADEVGIAMKRLITGVEAKGLA